MASAMIAHHDPHRLFDRNQVIRLHDLLYRSKMIEEHLRHAGSSGLSILDARWLRAGQRFNFSCMCQPIKNRLLVSGPYGRYG